MYNPPKAQQPTIEALRFPCECTDRLCPATRHGADVLLGGLGHIQLSRPFLKGRLTPLVTLTACGGALSFIHCPFPAHLFQQQTPYSPSVGGIYRKEGSNPSPPAAQQPQGPQPLAGRRKLARSPSAEKQLFQGKPGKR